MAYHDFRAASARRRLLLLCAPPLPRGRSMCPGRRWQDSLTRPPGRHRGAGGPGVPLAAASPAFASVATSREGARNCRSPPPRSGRLARPGSACPCPASQPQGARPCPAPERRGWRVTGAAFAVVARAGGGRRCCPPPPRPAARAARQGRQGGAGPAPVRPRRESGARRTPGSGAAAAVAARGRGRRACIYICTARRPARGRGVSPKEAADGFRRHPCAWGLGGAGERHRAPIGATPGRGGWGRPSALVGPLRTGPPVRGGAVTPAATAPPWPRKAG